ncbi:hypothetical protein GCM10010094_72600 [Streptomyces flaveus]|uniref:Uncharacterized protein n=1 Tax=Streptomyces flaveus TaxID=66370 RepID=A0A917RCL0_9ACTN|nr:hypothetical protein GCM10010094_72600 [Streptomyces flaveus]
MDGQNEARCHPPAASSRVRPDRAQCTISAHLPGNSGENEGSDGKHGTADTAKAQLSKGPAQSRAAPREHELSRQDSSFVPANPL